MATPSTPMPAFGIALRTATQYSKRLMKAYPALRNIDAIPVEQEGQEVICLHDPEGYTGEQLALSPSAFFVAASLDGKRDARAIQLDFARQFGGVLITQEEIEAVVHFLDEHGFLINERFEALRQRIEDTFRAAEIREPHLAGTSYPAEPDELRAFVDALFAGEGGPGEVPHEEGGAGPPQRCLVVPHIDFQRGGRCYAHGYRRMSEQGRPETVFVFGVAHDPAPVPFILTPKHFDTPFGVLETDRDIVSRLESACAWDPFEWEPRHRTEHSIEFQAVMLAYLYGAGVKIVPILCSQLAEGPEVRDPGERPEVCRFLEACREIAEPAENRVSVVAAADLAHVGRRFGDPFDINEAIIRSIERRDTEDLQYVVKSQPEAFYRSVMKDSNQRKVCGLGCIYAALKTVDGAGARGEVLHYDHAPDPLGGVVSFASVALM